jgi:hypothetical protein
MSVSGFSLTLPTSFNSATTTDTLAFYSFVGLVGFGLYRTTLKADSLPFPPGPKSSWWGGVALPKTYPWLVYADWQKTYGTLILLAQMQGY